MNITLIKKYICVSGFVSEIFMSIFMVWIKVLLVFHVDYFIIVAATKLSLEAIIFITLNPVI